ncbi:protein LNK1 [Sesamum angolense]|uniref:Protein LNK1 n=1 Tax=Sesamum angolense TaxID=2727404 RepID=A0AAE1WYC1_9LAMI|nr:protein LNK1 [Sesamum angolense]
MEAAAVITAKILQLLFQFEDIVWDELCHTDDHLVPHSESEQPVIVPFWVIATRNFAVKQLVFQIISEIEPLLDMKGSAVSANDALLGDKITTVDNNSFSYPLGDITHTGNNLEFFANTEDKDSSDFLYYGWPEIGNFEDVDRMFRSCDSTFGLGASKEDELGWFSSADNIGGSGDVVNSDVNKFPCPESNLVETNSENHDSSRAYSVNDSAMTSAHVSYKDSSWTSEKSDLSNLVPLFMTEVNEHKKHFKLQNQSVGKGKEHYFGNGSFSYMNNLSNEVVQLPSEATTHQALQQQQASSPDSYNYLQNPVSFLPSDNTQLSDPTSVNLNISGVKSENNDLTSPSPRNSSNTSNQLPSMESSDDSPFQVTAPVGRGKREKLHSRQSSRSSGNSSLKNANVTRQAAMGDPGLTGKQVHYYGDKVENHSDIEGVSFVIPAELGSSNIQESSTMSPGVNDISLEAASFRQLQLVMGQLDLRTKLCIRDSLYRLARSAEQRHNHAKSNGGCGDDRDASGGFLAEGTNQYHMQKSVFSRAKLQKSTMLSALSLEVLYLPNNSDDFHFGYTSLMDMETDTNPIDRSIAHLLFHRPSESHAVPAHDSLPFKSSGVVHGSLTGPPLMVDNLVNCEEAASEIEKLSEC